MPTQNDVAARIIASLRLTEPDLDLSVGSLARKIIDAVAVPVSELTTEGHLVNYQYDIDSKTGPALDDFVRLFGMERIKAQRASGVVTFSRPASVAAKQVARIPIGTQIISRTLSALTVQTTASAVLDKDQTTIDVPVRTLLTGPGGNLAANTLTGIGGTIPGVTTVKNSQPLIGGASAESDSQLRDRFKATVFRNLAGTEHMYAAMALQFNADPSDPDSRPVSQANVLGPTKRWNEQLAITGGGATSTITDAVYIYPGSLFVTAADGTVQKAADYDYTISTYLDSDTNTLRTRISLTSLDGDDGTLYTLRFDYVSYYSRNDPQGTRFGGGVAVNNRIDIWINGEVGRTATAVPKYNAARLAFNDTPGDTYYRRRFITPAGTHPAAGDVFVPLGFSPIMAVPNAISVGGNTYHEGTNYDIVHQGDAFGMGPSSKAGLVWYTSSHGGPSAATLPSIEYVYNAVPGLLEDRIASQWRLLGTDVRVHAGRSKQYRFHLAVVYDPRFTASAVNAAINTALKGSVSGLGFNSALQASDILRAVHNVSGVDNVRFLTNTDDPVNYGIQVINPDGSAGAVSQSGGRAKDVYFDDATFPLFHSIRVIVKGKNTYGTS